MQHFTSCCTQTCCCLETILPSPTRRCCFKELAGCGRWVLVLVPGAGTVCCPRCPSAQCPMNSAEPQRGFLEVTEFCGYMGGPAGLAGPQGAMRSLSKLIKTLQALAYSETQGSLYSNQRLRSCLFALQLPNTGQNYGPVADRTRLK